MFWVTLSNTKASQVALSAFARSRFCINFDHIVRNFDWTADQLRPVLQSRK